jgi:CHAT domain-containing protein/tetratricopeptide (TPR) repeat protein
VTGPSSHIKASVTALCCIFLVAVPPRSPGASNGDDRPDAAGVKALADSLYETGRYDDAHAAYERYIDILRATGEPRSDIIDGEIQIAATHWKMGRQAEGERVARRALADARRLNGPGHVQVAECLSMLGLCCMAQGRFDEAGESFRAALHIFKEQIGEENEKVSMCLNNLGALYGETADWVHAEACYRASLEMNRKLFGDDDLRVARGMHNLAFALRPRDILRAEPLLVEALAIRRRHLGNEHPDVATTLHILARLRSTKGETQNAIELMEEVLAIRRRVLGPRHQYVAWSLTTLGYMFLTMNDLEQADKCYTEAIDIYAACGAEIGRMRVLSDKAGVRLRQGDVDEAERLALEAHEIHLARFGYAKPSYVILLARIQTYRGADAAAESLLAMAAQSFETQRLRAADALHRSAATSMSPYHELAAARLRLGRADEAWPAVEHLRGRVLIDQLAASSGKGEGWVYGLEEVQDALEPNEAILGWLDVTGFPEPAAWAYVIRNEGPVRWAPVAESAESARASAEFEVGQAVSNLAADVRQSLRFAAAWPTRVTEVERFDTAARALWRERIEPVREHLSGVTELIVIPSEVMVGVPVEALMDHEGRTIGSRYAISYAPSATAYCWLRDRERRQTGGIDRALLVGDPPVDEADAVAGLLGAEEDVVAMAVESRVLDETVLRSALAGNHDALATLPPLPKARHEVVAIGSFIPRSTVLVGRQASEDALERLATAGKLIDFDVLHFATHALIDPISPRASALVLSQLDLPDPAEVSGPDRITDGLLSVEEITSEWKLDADIVTLSGCQTALGTTALGEGYLGFANAFLYAGARSVVVSLWDVDDTATSLLMRRFYENLTGSYDGVRDGRAGGPMSKSHALREAKRWLRGYESSGSKPFTHPAYWAAFVLIGDRS